MQRGGGLVEAFILRGGNEVNPATLKRRFTDVVETVNDWLCHRKLMEPARTLGDARWLRSFNIKKASTFSRNARICILLSKSR